MYLHRLVDPRGGEVEAYLQLRVLLFCKVKLADGVPVGFLFVRGFGVGTHHAVGREVREERVVGMELQSVEHEIELAVQEEV